MTRLSIAFLATAAMALGTTAQATDWVAGTQYSILPQAASAPSNPNFILEFCSPPSAAVWSPITSQILRQLNRSQRKQKPPLT